MVNNNDAMSVFEIKSVRNQESRPTCSFEIKRVDRRVRSKSRESRPTCSFEIKSVLRKKEREGSVCPCGEFI